MPGFQAGPKEDAQIVPIELQSMCGLRQRRREAVPSWCVRHDNVFPAVGWPVSFFVLDKAGRGW
jgi:hypothetical protein